MHGNLNNHPFKKPSDGAGNLTRFDKWNATTGTVDTVRYVMSGASTRDWRALDTLAQSDGTTTQYFAHDGLGSVRQLVDASGSVGLAQTFDPYGNGFSKAGSAGSSFGYSGEQTDSNGFVFLRARYYNPAHGRFFQRDTWEGDHYRPESLNGYIYGLGNPILYSDPSGHDPWWCETANNPQACYDNYFSRFKNNNDSVIYVNSAALIPEVAVAAELLTAEVVVVEGGGTLFGGAEVVVVAEEAAATPMILESILGLYVLWYILEDNAQQLKEKGIRFEEDREGFMTRIGPYRPGDDKDDDTDRFNIAFGVTVEGTEFEEIQLLDPFCFWVSFWTATPTFDWLHWPNWLNRLPYDPMKPTGESYMDRNYIIGMGQLAAIEMSQVGMERFYAEVKSGQHQGRIVFNLAYVNQKRTVTFAELQYLLSKPYLLTITDFYEYPKDGPLMHRTETDARNVLNSGLIGSSG